MSNYVIYNGVMCKTDELYHYGVKDMKWGHRKAQPQTSVGRARSAYKQAKKDYNKSYNSAYGYSSRHMIGQYTNKKKRAEADRRWKDASDKAKALDSAKKAYKNEKKAAKQPNTPEEKAARRKRAIKVGATVAGAALATYGAYKVHNYVRSKNSELAQYAATRAMKYFDDMNLRNLEFKTYMLRSKGRYNDASNRRFRHDS